MCHLRSDVACRCNSCRCHTLSAMNVTAIIARPREVWPVSAMPSLNPARSVDWVLVSHVGSYVIALISARLRTATRCEAWRVDVETAVARKVKRI